MKEKLNKDQKLIRRGLKAIYSVCIYHKVIKSEFYSIGFSSVMILCSILKRVIKHGLSEDNDKTHSEVETIEAIVSVENFLINTEHFIEQAKK